MPTVHGPSGEQTGYGPSALQTGYGMPIPQGTAQNTAQPAASSAAPAPHMDLLSLLQQGPIFSGKPEDFPFGWNSSKHI